MTAPIELYAWPTPNAYKISIMLEECGLPYKTVPVDIMAGDQHKDEFLSLNPNGRMPVIIDPDGPDGEAITIFESGAILWYLAEKTGRFLPSDTRGKTAVSQWLMWQMAGFGPMLGQAHHFRLYAPETVQYGIDRYTNEARRLYKVLDKRLSESRYVAGDEYTIADMAIFPWALSYEKQGVEAINLPYVLPWIEKINSRPAVQAGLRLLEDRKRDPADSMNENERRALFGTR